MADPIFARLTDLCTHLERLARDVEPLAVQLQLEYLIGRLERLIDETIGLAPPAAEETP